MQSQTLTYQADGLVMDSQLFYEPGSGQRPGVLVFPEGFGGALMLRFIAENSCARTAAGSKQRRAAAATKVCL